VGLYIFKEVMVEGTSDNTALLNWRKPIKGHRTLIIVDLIRGEIKTTLPLSLSVSSVDLQLV